MPHIRIEYTPNLGETARIDSLCERVLATLVALRNDAGEPVFPAGGTRVLAFAATHAAVGPGDNARGFMYVHLRVAPGRSAPVLAQAGNAVRDAVADHLERHRPAVPCRLTVQIDEGHPVFEGKAQFEPVG